MIEGRDTAGFSDTPIDVDAELYPYCLVWTPIPFLTYLLPFVGHIGICDSKGVSHDFAGPYHISHGNLAFGHCTRYIRLSPRKMTPKNDAQAYDAAVSDANCAYAEKMHNLCFQNCHSHVATALDHVRYNDYAAYNMVIVAAWMFVFGRFVSAKRAAESLLPSVVLWTIIVLVVDAI